MKDRLIWLQQQLQRLEDNYAIASQWQSDFASVKNEVTDIINTYVEAVAPPPAIVYQAITPDAVQQLTKEITASLIGDICEARDTLITELKASENAVLAKVSSESQESDVTILAALSDTRAELLAAKPAAEPVAA